MIYFCVSTEFFLSITAALDISFLFITCIVLNLYSYYSQINYGKKTFF